MAKKWLISRRTALKGLGATLALPLLDVMGWADPPKSGSFKMPVRLGFVYTPFGFYPDNFWPKTDHLDLLGPLPSTFEPMRPVLSDMLLLQGLGNPQHVGDGPQRQLHRQVLHDVAAAAGHEVVDEPVCLLGDVALEPGHLTRGECVAHHLA